MYIDKKPEKILTFIHHFKKSTEAKMGTFSPFRLTKLKGLITFNVGEGIRNRHSFTSGGKIKYTISLKDNLATVIQIENVEIQTLWHIMSFA